LIEKVAERVSIKALFTLTGKLQLPYKKKNTLSWKNQTFQDQVPLCQEGRCSQV